MSRANNPHGISRILGGLAKLAIDMHMYNRTECYLNEAMTVAGQMKNEPQAPEFFVTLKNVIGLLEIWVYHMT
jgi:hypothetical protein